jgi:DNA-binding response OmpR family regulator
MAEPARTLLIVEDDDSLRASLARYLRAQGFAVVEADSAESAAAELDGGLRPALVLLDLNLPGDTGWDLLRGDWILRAGSPPVVITSATNVSPKRLAEFHVAGYLPKPCPLDTLVGAIDRLTYKEGAHQAP